MYNNGNALSFSKPSEWKYSLIEHTKSLGIGLLFEPPIKDIQVKHQTFSIISNRSQPDITFWTQKDYWPRKDHYGAYTSDTGPSIHKEFLVRRLPSFYQYSKTIALIDITVKV